MLIYQHNVYHTELELFYTEANDLSSWCVFFCLYSLFSQSGPLKPSGHQHWYLSSSTLTQVAPFWHGPASHGAWRRCWQRYPTKSGGQVHTNVESRSWQVPPFLQGDTSQWLSVVRLQWRPLRPEGHRQKKSLLSVGTHSPGPQGDPAHGSMCSSQMAPVKPCGQAHVNEATRSRHVPPFWHGDDKQSLMSVDDIKS